MSAQQDRDMRQLLAQLELLSHGSVQAWNRSAKGEPTQVLPFGESNPPHLYFRDVYTRQITDHGRGEVIGRAREELKKLQGREVDRSHVQEETVEELNERIVKRGEGFSVEEVASRMGVAPSQVRRARVAAEVSLLDGKPTDDRLESPKERAQRMKAHGYTERQIGLILGKPQSTINYWLRKAA